MTGQTKKLYFNRWKDSNEKVPVKGSNEKNNGSGFSEKWKN